MATVKAGNKPKTRPYPKGKAGTFDISIAGLEKMEERLRRQGRTDEADELAADIAGRRMAEMGIAPDAVSADDYQRLGTRGATTPDATDDQPAIPGSGALGDIGVKPSMTPEARAKRRDRKQLDQTVVMNGNMSRVRRMQVVKPALVKLGYTNEQATQIALNTPLNTAMYDRQAVDAALRYAYGITPDEIGKLEPDSIERAMAPNGIPMPPQARRAMLAADYRENPIKGTRTSVQAAGKGMATRFTNWWNPIAARIGDAALPVPLSTLFIANLAFLALIVPANSQGYSRAELLYAVLLGRVKWANGAAMPEKDPVPPSTIVTSIAGMAVGIEEAAQAIGTLAGGAGQAASAAGNAAKAVGLTQQGLAAGVLNVLGNDFFPGGIQAAQAVGGILGIGSGGGPAMNSGAIPPRQPHA